MSATDYPEIDFAEIRRWLLRGDIKQLAVDHDLTQDYVSKVLAGKRKNMYLVESAASLAAQNKARITAKTETLKRSL